MKPEISERDQRNFWMMLNQGTAYAVALQLASPRLVIPFLYVALGAPVVLAGMLPPIVQFSSMISGIFSAPFLRVPGRSRGFIFIGVILIGVALTFLASVMRLLNVSMLNILFLSSTVVIGLAIGANKLAFQDLMGRALSKDKRAPMLFLQSSIAGGVTLAITLLIGKLLVNTNPMEGHIALIWAAASISIIAAVVVLLVIEPKNATVPNEEHNGYFKDLIVNIHRLSQINWFRKFIGVRMMLLSIELATPFYAVHAATLHHKAHGSLGTFVIGSSLGAIVGGVLWQQLSKGATRMVMSLAPIAGIAAGLIAVLADLKGPNAHMLHATVFGLIALAAQGASNSRIVYLSQATTDKDRAYYISASNTLVGLCGIAFAFALGLLAQIQHVLWPIYVLIALNALTILVVRILPNPQDALESVENN